MISTHPVKDILSVVYIDYYIEVPWTYSRTLLLFLADSPSRVSRRYRFRSILEEAEEAEFSFARSRVRSTDE